MNQITNTILMIKPVGFRYNEQTASNNYYQHVLEKVSTKSVQEKALNEFNIFVEVLTNAGVCVLVFEDTGTSDTPDSIFPNNWVSFHADGRVVMYPMFALNRRSERRTDIFDSLVSDYGFAIGRVKDYTSFEESGKFLEGTGSMVLDRVNKVCYSALSQRTSRSAVQEFCDDFDYNPVCFVANQNIEGERLPIYHTNVMMSVGESFAVVCLDAIDDIEMRSNVVRSLEATGKEVVEITESQVNGFAGNMLQVQGDEINVVMSTSAYQSLAAKQIATIEKHGTILHSSLDTIEACGGGSARCMMAEVFLPNNCG